MTLAVGKTYTLPATSQREFSMGINPEDIDPKSPLGKKILAAQRKQAQTPKPAKKKVRHTRRKIVDILLSPAQNESELQIQAVHWFRHVYPAHYYKLYSIPNGGHRSKITATYMKAEGTLAGAWDLFLAVPRGGKGGLYIETKFGKNKLSQSQIDFRRTLMDSYEFAVYYTLEEFKQIINKHMENSQ